MNTTSAHDLSGVHTFFTEVQSELRIFVTEIKHEVNRVFSDCGAVPSLTPFLLAYKMLYFTHLQLGAPAFTHGQDTGTI